MAIYNTYIQQMAYDGTSYSSGSVVNIYEKFHIICQEFPFKKNPKPKDLPTRDWAGEDGLDVYVPAVIPMDAYEVEVTFLYAGKEQAMRSDIAAFIDFIYGREKAKPADTVKNGRLAIYDEYVGMGRKDVVVTGVDNELFWINELDTDTIAQFKVKFKVYDPTTEGTLHWETSGGVSVVTNIDFVVS